MESEAAEVGGRPTEVGVEPTEVRLEPTEVGLEPTHLGLEPIELGQEPTEVGIEPTVFALLSTEVESQLFFMVLHLSYTHLRAPDTILVPLSLLLHHTKFRHASP